MYNYLQSLSSTIQFFQICSRKFRAYQTKMLSVWTFLNIALTSQTLKWDRSTPLHIEQHRKQRRLSWWRSVSCSPKNIFSRRLLNWRNLSYLVPRRPFRSVSAWITVDLMQPGYFTRIFSLAHANASRAWEKRQCSLYYMLDQKSAGMKLTKENMIRQHLRLTVACKGLQERILNPRMPRQPFIERRKSFLPVYTDNLLQSTRTI